MKNMYYIWGMIFGIIFGLLIVSITILIKKYSKKDELKKDQFDERQILVRLKGFKFGFFTILIYNTVYAFYSIIVEKPILKTYASMILGIILGITVFAVYAIWKDAYVSLGEKRKNFLILFGACGLLNLLNGIRGIQEEMKVAEGGDPQIYAINFFAAILSGVIFLTFALKSLTQKEEEE